ncbi:hypothetical protein [Brachybacterium hainanense]|uniref:Uncharacterized protein n=1 Tax=Brachybacterium hainanense TaxID=1541174 RepID=A0ABV6RC28_9MICO
MIIWRGWGGLAVPYIGLCVLLFGLVIGTNLPIEGIDVPLIGVGMMAGGVLCIVHGWYLNQILPRRRADAWEAQRRPGLEAAAAEGRLAVDGIPPKDPAEAEAMTAHLIAQGRRQAARANQHTLFFIPLEFVGVMVLPLGAIIAFTNGMALLGG